MTLVVNIRFRNRGKIYFFSPNDLPLEPGIPVIVDTAKGWEYAICNSVPYEIDDERVTQPLRDVVRLATPEDTQTMESYRTLERQTLSICKRKVAEHGLDMKLIDVDFSFDGTKVTFHFTSDGRVDFRELVRDLGSTFHKRIELRQIGIRDGARLLGGIGPCGREFCCSTFLNEFQAISVKMAKTQSLSLNPVKISGACGNLMCCLKHEEAAYEDLQKDAPIVDSVVDTPLGKGLVIDVNLLRSVAKVRVETANETTMKSYPFAQLGYIIDGVYRAPTEQPEVIEKTPAFIPPKYEKFTNEQLEKITTPPVHERTKEHITGEKPRNSNRNRNKGDRQPQATQKTSQKTQNAQQKAPNATPEQQSQQANTGGPPKRNQQHRNPNHEGRRNNNNNTQNVGHPNNNKRWKKQPEEPSGQ